MQRRASLMTHGNYGSKQPICFPVSAGRKEQPCRVVLIFIRTKTQRPQPQSVGNRIAVNVGELPQELAGLAVVCIDSAIFKVANQKRAADLSEIARRLGDR